MDLANVTNAKRLALMRQIELKKHVWLDREMERILPPDLYRAAHSTLSTPLDEEKVRSYLATHGYEIQDVWSLPDIGAVLLKNGKIVSRFVVELVGGAA